MLYLKNVGQFMWRRRQSGLRLEMFEFDFSRILAARRYTCMLKMTDEDTPQTHTRS